MGRVFVKSSDQKSSVVFVDVDDTLIRTVGTKRIPLVHVVEKVRELAADGAALTCWSSGGAAYAEEVARELGIENCFQAFLAKPKLMIDDQAPAEWRYLKVLHPNEIA